MPSPTEHIALPAGQALVDHLRTGDVVAFVGAGFSAPATGTWGELLIGLAARTGDADVCAEVARRVKQRTAFDYEAAAQLVRDRLGDGFRTELRALVASARHDALTERLDLLRRLPLRAIITTNFDHYLPQQRPDAEAWADVLRVTGGRGDAWSRRFSDRHRAWPPIVQLHGSLSDGGPDVAPADHIVFSTQDYRRRLYVESGYVTFLRAVLATCPVLYLGFSFTDAYLNGLRSEVLAMFGDAARTRSLAWAVVADAGPSDAEHFARHEGIHLLPYDATHGHGGFDAYLRALGDAAAPETTLAGRLAGCRILWMDTPHNNRREADMLLGAVGARGEAPTIEWVSDPQAALERLRASEFDLVLSRWGHQPGAGPRASDAARLLTATHGNRPPVIVYCSHRSAEENGPLGRRLGAAAMTSTWAGLFAAIERALAPGSDDPVSRA
ncbi:MAG: SIR2 family protein [Myxococcota bacterium]